MTSTPSCGNAPRRHTSRSRSTSGPGSSRTHRVRPSTRSWTGPAGDPEAHSPSTTRCEPYETTVLVIDASVLAPALLDDGTSGDHARARLRGEQLIAPEVIDLEVVSAIRGQLARGAVDARRAAFAIADLIDVPMERAPHTALVGRCWELKDNLTPYDAVYVALAEVLDAVLVTADGRLANAAGIRCAVEVLQ
jgi:predicted nucleic acid-binding protein